MNRRRVLQSLLGLTVGSSVAAPARGAQITTTSRPAARPLVAAPDGTGLFVRSWGRGRPVLFVAPWGLNADWWEYQMTALASQSIRAVAFDRRGHGRSDESAGVVDFDALAGDIDVVIRQLDLHDVTLVGHSLGAAEVVRYLARHGTERVTRAVLVGTITPLIVKTADNPDGVDRVALERARDQFQKDRVVRIAEAAAGFFGAPANAVPQPTIDWWTRMMVDRCSLKVLFDLHVLMTETDFRPDLARVTAPTLIIHGDRDTSAPLETTARKTHRLIAGSTLRIYEGAAHGLPFTHMEQLTADLLAFARGGRQP
jgi:non-heme chloroperoxidase